MESSGTGRGTVVESQLLLLLVGPPQDVGPGWGIEPSQPEPLYDAPLHNLARPGRPSQFKRRWK